MYSRKNKEKEEREEEQLILPQYGGEYLK